MRRLLARLRRRLAPRRRPKRLVVDPNVLLSALRGPAHSPPALLLAEVRDRRAVAVACPRLIGEVTRSLRKPYFRERIDADAAHRLVTWVEKIVEMAEDPIEPEAILRDPSDDYLIALAKGGEPRRSSRATRTCSSTRGWSRARSARGKRASCSA